jgi:pimeloyl-ACP methyl ester carboxylesterase
MLNPPLLDSLQASVVATPRLKTHIITRGPEDGIPVILVHGNVSAARFFEELMVMLPPQYRVVAPDLRGYGRSEGAPVDATRGVRDFSDDLHALIQMLGLERPHLLGWSLGGNVVLQYALDHPHDVRSLTLLATGSPYGFGGTRDLEGTPTSPSYAGSGGGLANPEFVRLLGEGDRSDSSPFTPRNVMNAFYFKPPFRSPREDVFVDEMISMAVAPDNYPGDSVPGTGWPGVGPGARGVNNALSPKYLNQGHFAEIEPRPPVLWVRGADDQIISDTSFFDIGFLGQVGAVPGWPGVEAFPPQPMVSQIRAVMERYATNGGRYHEVVLPDCGHTPHVEKVGAFREAFVAFLSEAT